ncbi:hypothetical protein Tco_1259930 [Tanacetum coccineum]
MQLMFIQMNCVLQHSGYALMDATRKVELEHVQCLSESKFLMIIIKNHPFVSALSIQPSVLWNLLWTVLAYFEETDQSMSKFLWLERAYTYYCVTSEQSFIFHKQMITIMLPLADVIADFSSVDSRITGWGPTAVEIMQIRARDAYHNLQDDDIMKNIFNSGRNKNKVGMRIPAWMITDEMKLTEHYKMTPSVPRSPNPATETAESMPLVEKADEMILQDTIQVSLAEHKSHEEQEARENVALVDEHLAAEEIEKLVENPENVDDSSPPRHDDTSIPGTRLEPRSDKESPEVEIADKDTPMVDVTNIVTPVNVDDEEDEITDEVFELRRRVKGKNVEETRISPIPSPTRSPRNLSTLVSSDTEKLQELTVTHPTPSSGSSEPKLTKTNRLLSMIKAKPNRFKRYKSFFHELQGRYGYLFAHLKKRFMPRTSSDQLADNLHDVMM